MRVSRTAEHLELQASQEALALALGPPELVATLGSQAGPSEGGQRSHSRQ